MASRFRATNNGGVLSPALFNFDHLEPNVQSHLKNVYGTLSVGMLSAALGAYVHFWTGLGQWYLMTTLAAIGLLFWLISVKHERKNLGQRMGIYTGFTLLSGVSLGPLLQLVILIDPSIIVTALAGTALIFISFTMSALLTRSRTFLYMGGFLMSSLMYLMIFSLISRLTGSRLGFDIVNFASLGIFSAFVLYDTQLIVEKKRRGDDDFIWHAVSLFIDAIDIFRSLMIILANKEAGKRRRRDD
ncbi:unnamed protein product [Candidula unifasciata]|uniref:Bax inhibitor 1 n=1 Tax=Candidula unifasciata TaxID=100452 RepID=A0A8S3YF26_9EUPU|nr:unnamed protein product [Candidula unifasciata]